MKYATAASILGTILLFSSFFSQQSPVGFTGSGIDHTCANCHGGGNYVLDTLFVDFPNNNRFSESLISSTEDVFLTYCYNSAASETAPVNMGFSMSAIDLGFNPTGNFTAGTNSIVLSDDSYLSHLDPKVFLDAKCVTYEFEYNYPNTYPDSGVIEFYYCVVIGNNGSGSAGDVVNCRTVRKLVADDPLCIDGDNDRYYSNCGTCAFDSDDNDPCIPSSAARACCDLLVTNKESFGKGSLFENILCAQTGDTIRFAASLAGKNIRLNAGQLLIDKSINIVSDVDVHIDGSRHLRAFEIAESANVFMKGIEISGGQDLLGSAILNRGTLILEDVIVNNSLDSAIREIENQGTLVLEGCTELL